MDKNRIEGTAKELKGSIKEAAGKLVGNVSLENQGKAEKVAGKAQAALGSATDAIKDKFR